ncbi:MAG: hypothetical protein WC782_14805 [Methylococcaceae bacterium]
MDYLEIAKLASPIVVGFLSAYAASLIALKKFKKEKFWDERRTAYAKVVSAFEELLYWAEQERAAHCCEPYISVASDPESALREIRRFSKIGSLQFSEQFYEKLKEADIAISSAEFDINEAGIGDNDEQSQHEWRFIRANTIREIVEGCLPELLKLAKNELPTKT